MWVRSTFAATPRSSTPVALGGAPCRGGRGRAVRWSPADHVLRVDCGELIGFGFPLSDVDGGKLTAANALFTGWVTADGATFHFENSTKNQAAPG